MSAAHGPNRSLSGLTIQLSRTEGGAKAVVTYSHTSLGPEGDKFVAAFTEAYYVKFMQDWEARMNYFLTSHKALPAGV